MSPRKRRRDQAFSEDEVEPQLSVEEAAVLDDKERREKEQEVWDAIREAHYEAIEQLPLTLQRQLSLMRKLDEQSVALTSRLYPTLQRYIQQRQAMAEISENEASASDLHALNSNGVGDVESNPSTQVNGHSHKNGDSAEVLSRGFHNGALRPSPRTSTPDSLPPDSLKDPETTRELLSHVAWISEELLRASQEKVNLAQANHDSVERHIRLLDQAIKEQMASLSLEKSQPTTGIAIHLPELVIPEWPRKNQTTVLSDDELNETYEKGVQTPATEKTKGRSKTSQRNSKKKGKERIKAGQSEQSKDSISLTITLPATTQQDDIGVQLNEELYCYCNRVSFGEMIACDNESCEREWFHLGCVGLTEIPEGEWFCEDCRDDEA